MKKIRPRTKPPEVRREEIMDAAERLFLAQGVAATTVDDVAAGADVAKGTVYLHFASRQALLAALGERFAEKHLARIKAAISARSEQDWPGKLAAWAEASVAFYLDSIELHDMLFHEARAPTREGLVDNIIIDHLAWLLNAGAAAAAWSVGDARFAAVFLFSGMHGIVDDAHLREKRIASTRLVKGRLIKRLQSACFRTVGLHSDDS
jgi:AcrR family transcriptional regulator